jgi:hypothetical protein
MTPYLTTFFGPGLGTPKKNGLFFSVENNKKQLVFLFVTPNFSEIKKKKLGVLIVYGVNILLLNNNWIWGPFINGLKFM